MGNQNPDREFLLRVSYLEIYNEVIKDLLNPINDNLKIHETSNVKVSLSIGLAVSLINETAGNFCGESH